VFGVSRRASRLIEDLGRTAKEKDVAAALRASLDQQFGKVSEFLGAATSATLI
jgi:hypothetical protein